MFWRSLPDGLEVTRSIHLIHATATTTTTTVEPGAKSAIYDWLVYYNVVSPWYVKEHILNFCTSCGYDPNRKAAVRIFLIVPLNQGANLQFTNF